MNYKTALTVQINLICTVMYRAVLARGPAYDGLLYRRSTRGDRLCVPAAGALRVQVLRELHATPGTLVVTRR